MGYVVAFAEVCSELALSYVAYVWVVFLIEIIEVDLGKA
jgi:hypothetical protein